MKLKTLVIVVVLLAAAAALVQFTSRPKAVRAADRRVGAPLVDSATAEKAARISISDQGKTVRLAKQADGSWQVPDYYDFPADFRKLSTFVGELTGAKIEQLVTVNPERIARLEFKDTKIELRDGADKILADITLGKTAEAGGRFVRFGEEPRAYRATLSAYLDADPKSWAQADLLPVKAEDIAKVEIDFAGASPVVATRATKEDDFSVATPPAGQKLNSQKITSLLSSLGSLRFSETTELADPGVQAAKEHQRSVKLTTFDGKTWSVALGRKPEEKRVKPEVPGTDGKTGPAALGTLAAVNAAGENAASAATPATPAAPLPGALAKPEIETIPAGPVYAFVSSSDPVASVNQMGAKRALQVYEYASNSIPEKPADLFEPAPMAPHAPAPEKKTPEAAESAPPTAEPNDTSAPAPAPAR